MSAQSSAVQNCSAMPAGGVRISPPPAILGPCADTHPKANAGSTACEHGHARNTRSGMVAIIQSTVCGCDQPRS
jgi:hypothetical protein